MNYENILSNYADGITTITINRPKKLNALNKNTIQELHDAFDAAENDKNTKEYFNTNYVLVPIDVFERANKKELENTGGKETES